MLCCKLKIPHKISLTKHSWKSILKVQHKNISDQINFMRHILNMSDTECFSCKLNILVWIWTIKPFYHQFYLYNSYFFRWTLSKILETYSIFRNITHFSKSNGGTRKKKMIFLNCHKYASKLFMNIAFILISSRVNQHESKTE